MRPSAQPTSDPTWGASHQGYVPGRTADRRSADFIPRLFCAEPVPEGSDFRFSANACRLKSMVGQPGGLYSFRTPSVPALAAKGDPTLPHELLAALSGDGRVRKLAAGKLLFHEGDASDAMYLLLSGRLKVYACNDSGREVV